MQFTIKRLLATCLLMITSFVVHANSKIPDASAISDHNRLAFAYFDPDILKKLKEKSKGKQKKKIRQAMYLIKEGRLLPPDLKKFILQKLAQVDVEKFADPAQAIADLRQEQGIAPNVNYTKDSSSYHEILSEEKTYTPLSQLQHFISLTLQNSDDTPQKSMSRKVKKAYTKKEILRHFIPLAKLLKMNQENIPEPYCKELLKHIDTFLILEKKLDRLEESIDVTKDFDQSLEDKIDDTYEKLATTYREIMLGFKQLNIPKKFSYLIDDRDELNYNPSTHKIEVWVDHYSQTTITGLGYNLIVKLNRVEEEEEEDNEEVQEGYNEDDEYDEDEFDEIQDLYAYEELTIKDYQRQQETNYLLMGYLKVMYDKTTGAPYYHVYYEVYDKKSRFYYYYKYTPEGIEEIQDDDFFMASQDIDTTLLIYDKMGSKPFHTLSAWIPATLLRKIKSACIGGIIVGAFWMYMNTS